MLDIPVVEEKIGRNSGVEGEQKLNLYSLTQAELKEFCL